MPRNIRKMRGITFVLDKNDVNYEKSVDEFNLVKEIYQRIFKTLVKSIKAGDLVNIKKFGTVFLQNGQEVEIPDTELRDSDLLKDIFSDAKYNFSASTKTYQKEILRYTLRQILGYWKRNDMYHKDMTIKIPRCTFKGLTINYSESPAFDGSDLKIPTLEGSRKFKIHKVYSKFPVGKMGRLGGNLKLIAKSKRNKQTAVLFKAFEERYEEAAYDPVDFIGFDVNKEAGYWLVFDDRSVIARTQKIDMILKIKDIFNKIIAFKSQKKDGTVVGMSMEKLATDLEFVKKFPKQYYYRKLAKLYDANKKEFTIKSRQRRPLRYIVQELLHKVETQYRHIANAIADRLENERLGIAIDKITTGAENGEYGQNFGKIMIEVCLKRNIPFYTVPSAFTSRMCSKCKYVDKNNRDKNEFNCKKCGHKDNSHNNAAVNIKNLGVEFFEDGCIYGVHEGRRMDSAKKKNKEWQLTMNGIKITKKVKEQLV